MTDIILHPATATAISQFIEHPAHAALITGPAGSGKYTLSLELASRLLDVAFDKLDSYPHLRIISPVEGKAIPIETIREMQRQLVLSIPGVKSIARIVIIEDAHLMTTEAQNALLKTLEEPPMDTILILTAHSPDSLLKTIQSRVRQLQAIPPDSSSLKDALLAQGFSAKDIDTALLLAGNLPGLTHAMLHSDQNHPLYQATTEARKLLQSKAYDRLLMVDALSKQKQLCIDIAFILGQMARTALTRSTTTNAAGSERWQRILSASYEAEGQLRSNAQAKLVMTNFLLTL